MVMLAIKPPLPRLCIVGGRRAESKGHRGRAGVACVSSQQDDGVGSTALTAVQKKKKAARGSRCPRDLEGEHVVVVGLGLSGRAACELALSRGAKVTATDSNLPGLDLSGWLGSLGGEVSAVPCGRDGSALLAGATRVVLSPGVAPSNGLVREAIRAGVPVSSELAFACEALLLRSPSRREDDGSGVRVVAVTGTNGKSSVTHFTAQLLEKAGVRAWAGGNLGVPASVLALGMRRADGRLQGVRVAVLEVSSYMLEHTAGAESFRPHAAAILNLTPDHLERHGDMASYAAAKCQIFRRMSRGALALLPAGDALLLEQASEANPALPVSFIGGVSCPGVSVIPGSRAALIAVPGRDKITLDMGQLPPGVAGAHNAVNAAVAAALAAAAGGPAVTGSALQAGIRELQGLPHRMEVLGRCSRGLEWINDSKATNVESTAAGLEGLRSEGRRAVVLLGGVAKRISAEPSGGLGFGAGIAPLLKQHGGAVAFGKDGAAIHRELTAAGVPCILADGLRSAVEEAKKLAGEGDALLLSPGCASFDEFSSFEHRGRVFAQLFRECGAWQC